MLEEVGGGDGGYTLDWEVLVGVILGSRRESWLGVEVIECVEGRVTYFANPQDCLCCPSWGLRSKVPERMDVSETVECL